MQLVVGSSVIVFVIVAGFSKGTANQKALKTSVKSAEESDYWRFHLEDEEVVHPPEKGTAQIDEEGKGEESMGNGGLEERQWKSEDDGSEDDGLEDLDYQVDEKIEGRSLTDRNTSPFRKPIQFQKFGTRQISKPSPSGKDGWDNPIPPQRKWKNNGLELWPGILPKRNKKSTPLRQPSVRPSVTSKLIPLQKQRNSPSRQVYFSPFSAHSQKGQMEQGLAILEVPKGVRGKIPLKEVRITTPDSPTVSNRRPKPTFKDIGSYNPFSSMENQSKRNVVQGQPYLVIPFTQSDDANTKKEVVLPLQKAPRAISDLKDSLSQEQVASAQYPLLSETEEDDLIIGFGPPKKEDVVLHGERKREVKKNDVKFSPSAPKDLKISLSVTTPRTAALKIRPSAFDPSSAKKPKQLFSSQEASVHHYGTPKTSSIFKAQEEEEEEHKNLKNKNTKGNFSLREPRKMDAPAMHMLPPPSLQVKSAPLFSSSKSTHQYLDPPVKTKFPPKITFQSSLASMDTLSETSAPLPPKKRWPNVRATQKTTPIDPSIKNHIISDNHKPSSGATRLRTSGANPNLLSRPSNVNPISKPSGAASISNQFPFNLLEKSRKQITKGLNELPSLFDGFFGESNTASVTHRPNTVFPFPQQNKQSVRSNLKTPNINTRNPFRNHDKKPINNENIFSRHPYFQNEERHYTLATPLEGEPMIQQLNELLAQGVDPSVILNSNIIVREDAQLPHIFVQEPIPAPSHRGSAAVGNSYLAGKQYLNVAEGDRMEDPSTKVHSNNINTVSPQTNPARLNDLVGSQSENDEPQLIMFTLEDAIPMAPYHNGFGTQHVNQDPMEASGSESVFSSIAPPQRVHPRNAKFHKPQFIRNPPSGKIVNLFSKFKPTETSNQGHIHPFLTTLAPTLNSEILSHTIIQKELSPVFPHHSTVKSTDINNQFDGGDEIHQNNLKTSPETKNNFDTIRIHQHPSPKIKNNFDVREINQKISPETKNNFDTRRIPQNTSPESKSNFDTRIAQNASPESKSNFDTRIPQNTSPESKSNFDKRRTPQNTSPDINNFETRGNHQKISQETKNNFATKEIPQKTFSENKKKFDSRGTNQKIFTNTKNFPETQNNFETTGIHQNTSPETKNNFDLRELNQNNAKTLPDAKNNFDLREVNQNNPKIIPESKHSFDILGINPNNPKITPETKHNLEILGINQNNPRIIPETKHNFDILGINQNTHKTSSIIREEFPPIQFSFIQPADNTQHRRRTGTTHLPKFSSGKENKGLITSTPPKAFQSNPQKLVNGFPLTRGDKNPLSLQDNPFNFSNFKTNKNSKSPFKEAPKPPPSKTPPKPTNGDSFPKRQPVSSTNFQIKTKEFPPFGEISNLNPSFQKTQSFRKISSKPFSPAASPKQPKAHQQSFNKPREIPHLFNPHQRKRSNTKRIVTSHNRNGNRKRNVQSQNSHSSHSSFSEEQRKITNDDHQDNEPTQSTEFAQIIMSGWPGDQKESQQVEESRGNKRMHLHEEDNIGEHSETVIHKLPKYVRPPITSMENDFEVKNYEKKILVEDPQQKEVDFQDVIDLQGTEMVFSKGITFEKPDYTPLADQIQSRRFRDHPQHSPFVRMRDIISKRNIQNYQMEEPTQGIKQAQISQNIFEDTNITPPPPVMFSVIPSTVINTTPIPTTSTPTKIDDVANTTRKPFNLLARLKQRQKGSKLKNNFESTTTLPPSTGNFLSPDIDIQSTTTSKTFSKRSTQSPSNLKTNKFRSNGFGTQQGTSPKVPLFASPHNKLKDMDSLHNKEPDIAQTELVQTIHPRKPVNSVFLQDDPKPAGFFNWDPSKIGKTETDPTTSQFSTFLKHEDSQALVYKQPVFSPSKNKRESTHQQRPLKSMGRREFETTLHLPPMQDEPHVSLHQVFPNSVGQSESYTNVDFLSGESNSY